MLEGDNVMAVDQKSQLGAFFMPDVTNPILVTWDISSTSKWLVTRFGAKTVIGKDPLEWLALSGEPGQSAEWVAKIKPLVGYAPQPGISHLALRLKSEYFLDDIMEPFASEGFIVQDHGKVDGDGFGWRIFKAPREFGEFFVHVARRPKDVFTVA